MHRLTMLVLLSLWALWPVGSAGAAPLRDELIVNGAKYFIGERAEANGHILFAPAPAPTQHATTGGIVLTEGGNGAPSDVLFYSSTLRGYVFQSDTATSLSGNFSGFTSRAETGKLQSVGTYFGFANDGAIRIRSDASATPLPPTWTIMFIGLVGVGFMLYRRQRPDGVGGLALT
jgi:hypothetical protein